MASVISVEMGETKVSSRSGDRLLAIGLGACVGLCLYDPISSVAAMVHVVLPRTPTIPTMLPGNRPLTHLPGKCGDSAIPHVLAAMERAGAVTGRLRAAIVGGAQIFTPPLPKTPGTTMPGLRLEIGPRNVEAIRTGLARAKIPLDAEQIGGHCGRTVTFHAGTGQVFVRPIGAEERLLVCLATRQNDQRSEKVTHG
jgi:chemotaxis protein CheD